MIFYCQHVNTQRLFVCNVEGMPVIGASVRYSIKRVNLKLRTNIVNFSQRN